jgi:hypothetical protein
MLSVVAIMWGIFANYSIAFPGPSGEWIAVSVFACYIVNIPAGAISLIIALGVKKGNPRLRIIIIITSLLVVALPLIGSMVFWLR